MAISDTENDDATLANSPTKKNNIWNDNKKIRVHFYRVLMRTSLFHELHWLFNTIQVTYHPGFTIFCYDMHLGIGIYH